MGAPGTKWNALFENHLAFLAAYRGSVIRLNDLVQVDSEKKEFTYLIPGSGEPMPELLKRFSTLQIFPWANRAPNAYAGFSESGSVTYMRTIKPVPAPPARGDLEIKLVADKSELFSFSGIQCLAFLQTPESYEAWAPFLHHANLQNWGAKNQRFYLALLGGKAVGAMLALDAENITGIYALAVSADERNKGLGAALLAKGVADALSLGSEAITLQVATGSKDEGYAAKHGFNSEFNVQILTRT